MLRRRKEARSGGRRGRLLSWCESVLCLTGALLGAAAGVAKADDPAPDYAAYKQSYSVPFARPVDFKHLTEMTVRASLNGGPVRNFQVDTGSVGIVASADEVPNIDPNARPGQIKYSSSGVEEDGVWTTATVTFPDSKDAQGRVATAVVPVLAVREKRFSGVGVNAVAHAPVLNPRVYMFGVGFGRGRAAHPENNPFVNLSEMQAGTMRRGYTITRAGFTLGLTAAGVGPGYVFQKLAANPVSPGTAALRPGLKDWATPPGGVTVGAVSGPAGTVLMDTGLTNMMLAVPGGPAAGEVPPGEKVTVALLGGRLHYDFKAGDSADPLTPRRVTWITPTHGAFVNTGLRALSAFDYLYDADGGYFGLRPVGAAR